MRNTISKTIVAGVAALAMAAAVVLPTDPGVGRLVGGSSWHGGGGWGGGWHGGTGAAAGTAAAGAAVGTAAASGIRAIGAAASGTTAGGARRSPPAWPRARSPPTPTGAGTDTATKQRLLAVSSDLRRLRQLSRPKLGQRLLVQRASARLSGASRKRGPFRLGRRPEHASGHRRRNAGRGREGEGQAAPRTQSEIGETLRLDAVAVEADRLDRFDADLKPLGEPTHEVRVQPSAPADQPARRRPRDVPQSALRSTPP